jgi:hypothetical protein
VSEGWAAARTERHGINRIRPEKKRGLVRAARDFLAAAGVGPEKEQR